MSTRQRNKGTGGALPIAQDKLHAIGFDAVCASLSDGKTMTNIASAAGVSFGSLQAWLDADPERSARAREARRRAARLWDEKAEAAILSAADPFELARAKDLAHHYRWRASKIAPREYGDKLAVGGDEDMGPIKVLRIERVIVQPPERND